MIGNISYFICLFIFNGTFKAVINGLFCAGPTLLSFSSSLILGSLSAWAIAPAMLQQCWAVCK